MNYLKKQKKECPHVSQNFPTCPGIEHTVYCSNENDVHKRCEIIKNMVTEMMPSKHTEYDMRKHQKYGDWNYAVETDLIWHAKAAKIWWLKLCRRNILNMTCESSKNMSSENNVPLIYIYIRWKYRGNNPGRLWKFTPTSFHAAT